MSSSLPHVRVATDGWNFETYDGTPIVPLGGNVLNDVHPGQGTLFQRFDAEDVERRFAAMAEVGLNCLRQPIGTNEVFDYDKGELIPEGIDHWERFLELAERYGVYLMPVGGYPRSNDWFDVELLADSGRALDDSCAFWEAFASHFSDRGSIWAWDLRNELLYWNRSHMTTPGGADEARIEAMIREDWPDWLERKYATLDHMNRAYGNADYDGFDAVPGSLAFVDQPYDMAAYDFRHYLNDRGYQWCKRQCDVLRRVAPHHMLVSGNNAWLSPDQDLWLSNGFHNRAVHELFDFVTHHPYPAVQAAPDGRGDPLDGGDPLTYWLNACIAMSRLDHYGKPVVIQEFGWYGGGASRFLGELPHRSESAFVDYMRVLIDTLIPHSNGFLNWPLMNMPDANDISNLGGIFTHDAKPRGLASVYSDLATRLHGRRQTRTDATTMVSWSLLGLYTSRACLDAFFDECHALISAGEVPDFKFIP